MENLIKEAAVAKVLVPAPICTSLGQRITRIELKYQCSEEEGEHLSTVTTKTTDGSEVAALRFVLTGIKPML